MKSSLIAIRTERLCAEIATKDATIARLREAMEWLATNEGTEHPHYPYRDDDVKKWVFPYLVSNAGGFGGGVGHANFDTLLDAVEAARDMDGKS